VRRLVFLALLLVAGCPKAPEAVAPPAPVAPPPPLPKVPPGCELSLAGNYHHQDDASFRYDIADDGSTVTIHAFRQYGQTREEIASTAAIISLQRTPEGLRGSASTQAKTLSGQKTCTVSFPYEVTACTPTGITLRTVHELRLTETCELEDPLHLDFAENVLVRELPADAGTPIAANDAGALDAGAAEAGAIDAGVAPLDAGLGSAADGGAPALDAGAILTQGVDGGAQDAGRP
jgi:hypothetical protein